MECGIQLTINPRNDIDKRSAISYSLGQFVLGCLKFHITWVCDVVREIWAL